MSIQTLRVRQPNTEAIYDEPELSFYLERMDPESDTVLGCVDNTVFTVDLNEAPSSSSSSDEFNDPDADITLRTSDMVDFRVFKVILGFASPVFKTMFTIPQPKNVEVPDTILIIPISESSAVLTQLLRFCYPVESPELADLEMSLIIDIYAAALKYELEAVIGPVKKILRGRADRSPEDAVAAYVAACLSKQKDDARATAMLCLKFPFPGPKVPQLALISAMDYHNLLTFHKDACKEVNEIMEKNYHDFVTVTCAGITPRPHSCDGRVTLCYTIQGQKEEVLEYSWWASSRETLSNALKHAPLDSAKLSLSTIAPALAAADCSTCVEKALTGWEETREAILAYFKKQIDGVDLEFSWE